MGDLNLMGHLGGGGGNGVSIADAVVTVSPSTYEYNGTTRTPSVSVTLDGTTLTEGTDYFILGETSASDVGTHRIVVIGKNDYSDYVEASWTITKATVTKPTSSSSSFTYDGTLKTLGLTGFDANTMAITNNTGTNAGTYTAVVSLRGENYKWNDNTTADISFTWTIAKAALTKPTVSAGALTYDGTEQAPTLTGFDGDTMSKSGDMAKTNAGDYTLTVSLADTVNYKWSDDTISAVNLSWSIAKRSHTKPTITTGTFTYAANTTRTPTTDANFDSSLMTKSGDTSAINAGDYTLVISLNDTDNEQWADSSTTALSLAWKINKASGSISVSPSTLNISGTAGTTGTSTITKNSDGNVSVQSSDSSVATASVSGNIITVTAVDDGTATITVNMAAGTNHKAKSTSLTVNVTLAHVYGVSWGKSSSTALTRTDDAALFTDPTPAVSGGSGSSPFDNRLPWSGMVKETISGNVMVKIPKFYYKWTNETNSLKLQISNVALTGFHTSPAHADRGDGNGERDYVYIGRYHCDANYKSTTGASPKASITRSAARTGCKGVGTGFSQLDYAMWWTIRMLYLVEYADWDSQKKIGYGCSDSGSKHNSGTTDSMTYHTGTTKANRTDYSSGVQYRYIEDPWGNVLDWCDGIVLSSSKPYVTNVIANYGDTTTNHTNVGTALSNSSSKYCISAWSVPTDSGLEWALFPSTCVNNSNYDTYVADYCGAGNACVCVGGDYFQVRLYGMFYSGSDSTSGSYDDVGARLQYLP